MAPLYYHRHRFPPEIIQHAIWLYLRFTLSYRDVEELLAERGLDLSYETVRRWVLKFGPAIARQLRQRRPRPSDRWHLDEMVVRIAGISGVPSITKARCSTCWSSAGATAGRRCGSRRPNNRSRHGSHRYAGQKSVPGLAPAPASQ